MSWRMRFGPPGECLPCVCPVHARRVSRRVALRSAHPSACECSLRGVSGLVKPGAGPLARGIWMRLTGYNLLNQQAFAMAAVAVVSVGGNNFHFSSG